MILGGANIPFLGIGNGDEVRITDGSVITSGYVTGNAKLFVTGGASITYMSVASGGTIIVSSGGKAGTVKLEQDGKLAVGASGVADEVIISGGSFFIDEGGKAHIQFFGCGHFDKCNHSEVTFGGLMVKPKDKK